MKGAFFANIFLFIATVSVAQNVGIGVQNPARAKLEVHGAAGRTSAIFGGESTGISLQRDWPSIGFNQYYTGTEGRYIGNGFALVQYLDPALGVFNIDVFAAGTTNGVTPAAKRAITIQSTGAISLGTFSLNAATTITRRSTIPTTLAIAGTTHHSLIHTGPNEDVYLSAGRDYGTVLINNIPNGDVSLCSTGMVGINTGAPTYTLDIAQKNGGGIRLVEPAADYHYWLISTASHIPAELSFSYDENVKGFIDAVSGNYISVSDRRLKHNIRELSPLLDKLMQLKPVEYEMNDNNPGNLTTIGFVAQDVKAVFPQLVQVYSDTSVKGRGIPDLHTLNYTGFAPVAIKAIQEQQQIITVLRSEVDELKKTVDGLYKQLYRKEY